MKFSQIYNIVRFKLLYGLGTKLGLIDEYSEELLKKTENNFYYGTPVSVLLTNGLNLRKCHDRAYALTMAFDECNLIRGWLPKYGKTMDDSYDPDFEHSWVEDDKYVYDTTFLKRFNKRFYHYLFGTRTDAVISSEELNNDEEYKKMKDTTREDIENSVGLEAINAFMLNAILEQKEKKSGENLSHLRCQVPQIDMAEFAKKQRQALQEMDEYYQGQ